MLQKNGGNTMRQEMSFTNPMLLEQAIETLNQAGFVVEQTRQDELTVITYYELYNREERHARTVNSTRY